MRPDLTLPLISPILALTLILSACGGGSSSSAPSQTAAKVGDAEITVHQINHLLAQQRGLKPEQVEQVSQQILERLIDQQLTSAKALDKKLDRDPKVVQQLEAVRREVLAQAYLDSVVSALPKPTPEEVHAYFESKPALFSQRRVYQLQEILVEVPAERQAAIKEQLAIKPSLNDFLAYLKSQGVRYSANQVVKPAEQLPMALLDQLAKLKEGQATLVAAPRGLQIMALIGFRDAPVKEAEAQIAIEQYLLKERQRERVGTEIKTLRSATPVVYQGKFATAHTAAASAPIAVATPPGNAVPASAKAAAVQSAPASTSQLSANEIAKGVGLK